MDVVDVVTPLVRGVAQVLHCDQVVELSVQLEVQEVEGKEDRDHTPACSETFEYGVSGVGVDSGPCIREMCFGCDNWAKHDKKKPSIGRAGDSAPTSYDFAIRDAAHPWKSFFFTCCGSRVRKIRVSGFGSWQAKSLASTTCGSDEAAS